MQKKYQIFVSSTFLDLKSERQAAQKSILNLGHIPAGMEMFPATGSEQLEYIYKIIDDCDYYVLIIGGRYGSLDESGLSYTEMEFEYALKRNMPILVFRHSDVSKLEFGKVDSAPEQQGKLSAFRDKASSGRVVKDWTNSSDLEASIITSLTLAFTETPQVGWRRDTDILDEKSLRKIANLQAVSERYRKEAQQNAKKLQSFEDIERAEIDLKFLGNGAPHVWQFSGRRILKQILPLLRHGLDKGMLRDSLAELVAHSASENSLIEWPIEISDSSLEDIFMFLEAFDVASGNGGYSSWVLKEDKRHLMKAVFIANHSLNSYGGPQELSDEYIPF